MNEEKLARSSKKIADAPVPDAIQIRLRQARQAALAQSASVKGVPHGTMALVLRYPRFAMASLALALAVGAFWAQQQHQRDAAIDIALLSSDVPMDLLLEPSLLEVGEQ